MCGNLPTKRFARPALNPAPMATAALPFTFVVHAGGRAYWRFRSKETGSLKLPGAPGDPAFLQAYRQAQELRLARRAAEDAGIPDESTWAWLIKRYLLSPEFAALADSTQLDYSRTCELLTAALGSEPFRYTTRGMLKDLRDDFASTPRKAHKVKQMASRLYSWADECELVPEGFNPAAGVRRLARKGGEHEIVPWSDAEIGWILAAAPAHVATVVMLALYTGQRREDVVTMTWQQWQGDVIRCRTSKTRALIDMPCHAALKAYLEQLRAGAKVVSLTGAICLTASGQPFSTADALSGALRRVVAAHPRVPDNRSMHGLRYAAAGRMAEGGSSVAAIEAVLGHRTFRMAMKYASARLRAAEGIAAMKGEL
jgi:integrase